MRGDGWWGGKQQKWGTRAGSGGYRGREQKQDNARVYARSNRQALHRSVRGLAFVQRREALSVPRKGRDIIITTGRAGGLH